MKAISRRFANFSLILVTLIWGATFVIVKRAIADLPPFPFLGLRFGLAFLTLLPFAWPYRTQVNSATLLKGLGLGGVLFLGYATQTIGLLYTTASNAGFITGLYVVIVPVMVALTTGRLPHRKLLIGVAMATAGLALLSLGPHFTLNRGDLWVLACAFAFAGHIFLVGRYAPQENALVLTTAQLLAVALLSGLLSTILPQPDIKFTANAWTGILLTAIPATSLAYLIQTKMQQFTTPTDTALIFSGEPVFSALFAYYLAGEVLSFQGMIGALLVLGGMLIAQFTESRQQQ